MGKIKIAKYGQQRTSLNPPTPPLLPLPFLLSRHPPAVVTEACEVIVGIAGSNREEGAVLEGTWVDRGHIQVEGTVASSHEVETPAGVHSLDLLIKRLCTHRQKGVHECVLGGGDPAGRTYLWCLVFGYVGGREGGACPHVALLAGLAAAEVGCIKAFFNSCWHAQQCTHPLTHVCRERLPTSCCRCALPASGTNGRTRWRQTRSRRQCSRRIGSGGARPAGTQEEGSWCRAATCHAALSF
jgi:hypothetical protein